MDVCDNVSLKRDTDQNALLLNLYQQMKAQLKKSLKNKAKQCSLIAIEAKTGRWQTWSESEKRFIKAWQKHNDYDRGTIR